MLYVQQSLAPDEELVHVGDFHWMYTLGGFIAIMWGTVLSILMIFAAVFLYKKMGWFPPGMGWLDAVRHLHPGLRICSFFIFVLGLLGFARVMVVKATTEIAITNKRLVFKQGLIARRVGEMSIDRIEGVNVLQTVPGRLFDYGRLAIRGMGVGEVILPSIAQPIIFRQAIERAKAI